MIRPALLFSVFLLAGAAVAGEPKVIELRQDGELILEIPLDESVPVEINALTGGLRAATTSDFACDQGGASCDDVQVSMSGASGSFSRSPSSVPRGSSVNFSWTSRGAWECEGIGLAGTNWPQGGKLPNGTQSVQLDIQPGTYEASIRCTNGPKEAVRGPLSITVTPPDAGIPEGCQGRQPAGMTRTASCVVTSSGIGSANCHQYSEVYRALFPGLAAAQQVATNRDQYLAMEFTVPQTPVYTQGAWGWVVPQYPPTFTGRNMQSISRCPGDFDQQKILEEMGPHCYMKQGSLPPNSVRWALAGSGATSRCLLEPGETYYFNVLYTDSPAGTPPSQLNWQCGSNSSTNVCGNNTESIFQ